MIVHLIWHLFNISGKNIIDEKSTSVRVTAWCLQATKPSPEPQVPQIYVATDS